MKSFKPVHTFLALSIGASLSSLAFAQAAPAAPAAATPEHSFTYNATFASHYNFRGQSQTDFKPALQLGADYNHASGLYIGTWASNVSWLRDFGVSRGRVELDIYGGFKKSFDDFTLDVGALRYQYPGGVPDPYYTPNTTEIYTSGAWKFISLKYSYGIGSKTFSVPDSKGSSYLDFTVAYPVNDQITATFHAGHQKFRGAQQIYVNNVLSNQRLSNDAYSYYDYKGEVAYDFGKGVSLAGGVSTTNANKAQWTPNGKRFTGKTFPYMFVKYAF